MNVFLYSYPSSMPINRGGASSSRSVNVAAAVKEARSTIWDSTIRC